MKKRKMIMGILILLLMILFVRLVCCDRRKEIVWLTEDSIENIQEELEYELNALLKKKGYSCKVHFVCFPMERYEENVERYLKNHSADIIYSNLRVVGDYYNQFYDFYKKGYLRGISLVEEDTDFYHAYSKATWENMKIDGEIFGVPAYANAGSGYYYVFNQRLLDKYQMDLSQISEDINSLKPLLSEVLQKEGAESSIIPMLPYEYMMFLPEYSELLDGIRVRESGEKPVAENILKNQKVCRSIFLMNEFYRKGFIKEPKEETLENGEFLVTIMVGDNPQMIQNYFDICCAEKGKDPLSLKIIKIGDSYTAYRTGGMNSVLRGDNEKESLDLLKLTVTDEEISHLLKYGNKYISDMPVMARWMFGNDFWVKTKQMLL